jgi:ATP-dependent RNA helicase RhlE
LRRCYSAPASAQGGSLTTFCSLGLPDPLLLSVEQAGFSAPTPIQARAVPLVVAGHDLFAEAPTGSGKTAAFALPILQLLQRAPEPTAPAVLVLAPTRELALQVAASFRTLGAGGPWPLRALAVIGGASLDDQIAALDQGVHVVVATPGRLLDLMRRDAVDLSQVRHLVLDEADKLLDADFIEEVPGLLEVLSVERQTLLFSATLPQRVLAVGARLMRAPQTVRIDDAPTPVATIEQRAYTVDAEKRRALLQHLLRAESWGQTLIFVATRRAAENLANKLRLAGFFTAALHGDLDQRTRVRTLKRFIQGRQPVLVATDLAARGIDVPSLAVVVNYDLPRSARDYVHRIGRTGRAGAEGLAVSLLTHENEAHFRLIEKRNGLRLPRLEVPGFERTGEVAPSTRGPAPVKGKRKSKKDKARERAAREAAAQGTPDGGSAAGGAPAESPAESPAQ